MLLMILQMEAFLSLDDVALSALSIIYPFSCLYVCAALELTSKLSFSGLEGLFFVRNAPIGWL